ncbi:hypothetical protein ACFVAJ_18625 [Agromyces sp. NPDC057679]|uniref:hypothetical protein n=1 Tax=Agromyces sp. NPDC057679 TaxID=3346207 RepID=UPI003670AE9D
MSTTATAPVVAPATEPRRGKLYSIIESLFGPFTSPVKKKVFDLSDAVFSNVESTRESLGVPLEDPEFCASLEDLFGREFVVRYQEWSYDMRVERAII